MWCISQVFAALIFLYDLYKSEPFAQNPFAAVFVKYLQVRPPEYKANS